MGLFEILGGGGAGEEWKDAQVLEPLNIYGIAKRECKEIREGTLETQKRQGNLKAK